MIKYKELKKNICYAIPCQRTNGKEDYITIEVKYDETEKCDIAFINNRYMGAILKKVREDANWLKIVS